MSAVLLIVLERPELRAAFNAALAETPYRRVYASDGEDGFDRFGEVRPDLVIAPMQSPRIDGPLLCKLLRKDPQGAELPIVLYDSGFRDPQSIRQTLERCEADGGLPLPFDASTLSAVLGPLLTPDDAGATDDFDITVDRLEGEDDGLDPALAAAALAADEAFDVDEPIEGEDDDMPTNPSLAERALFEAARGRPGSEAERVPVMKRPPGLEGTPLPAPAPRPPADVLEEPELPGSGAPSERSAPPPASESGGTDPRLREIPRDVSTGPIADVPTTETEARRRGLAESQLGKRLVKRVRQTFEQLDALDYYELLGVEPKAPPKKLRDAYFELSLEFHPDRFFLLQSGEVKQMIYRIYRRLTEAYDVLSDPRRRAAYEEALAQGRPKRAPPEHRGPAPAPPLSTPTNLAVPIQHPEAAKLLARAQAAFDVRDLRGARLFLSFALVYEPQNESLRAMIRQVASLRPRPAWA